MWYIYLYFIILKLFTNFQNIIVLVKIVANLGKYLLLAEKIRNATNLSQCIYFHIVRIGHSVIYFYMVRIGHSVIFFYMVRIGHSVIYFYMVRIGHSVIYFYMVRIGHSGILFLYGTNWS